LETLNILKTNNTSIECGIRDKIKEYHLSLSSMDVVKAAKGLIALTPEIDCDQTRRWDYHLRV
jgi:hypothetical protein